MSMDPVNRYIAAYNKGQEESKPGRPKKRFQKGKARARRKR